MVQINYAQKQVSAKIVYYGPGMSGKTTNLEVVHQRAPEQNRGELTSISTDGDRTLFFDFMPLDLGTVAGMRTCFQIYTVPGQVYYNSTRKLVLQGVDGVVFVADSSASMLQENIDSLRNLEENLNEYGKSLATLPLVIQLNKRDLPDALPVEDLVRYLNPYGATVFEAIANTGQGVFPTLKALAAKVLDSIHAGSAAPGAARAPAAPAPARGATAQAAPIAAPLPRQSMPAPTPAMAAPAAVHAQAPMTGATLARTGFHGAPPQAPAAAMQPPPMAHAPVQPQIGANAYGAPVAAPQYAAVPQPVAQPQMAPVQPAAQPLQMAGVEPMRAKLAQSGVHPMAQARPQAAMAAPAYAQPQPVVVPPPMMQAPAPVQPTLHLAQRPSSGGSSQLGSAPVGGEPARMQRPQARASSAPSAGRSVPSPLEGTRFRPRGQAAAPRHEPLPTPSAKPTGKLSTALFVAAAVAAGAALTFVAVAFF